MEVQFEFGFPLGILMTLMTKGVPWQAGRKGTLLLLKIIRGDSSSQLTWDISYQIPHSVAIPL